jgi:NADH dehydrogenase
MRKSIFQKEYPELGTSASNIYLVGRCFVSTYESTRCCVQFKYQVVDYVDDTVFLSTGETIQTKI